mmetsp:Transcript_9239/g.12017  ORF Transcript_9239/g.12017 Transcript_9239/m.12017 type:complete len:338 (-) Transcript_9239:1739-2752(-)
MMSLKFLLLLPAISYYFIFYQSSFCTTSRIVEPLSCAACVAPTESVVLITGASGGIGRDLAIWYAENGAKLILVARRKEQLLETKSLCSSQDPKKILTVALDLSADNAVTALFDTIRDHPVFGFGNGIDVLIMNHARIPYGLVMEHKTMEDIQNDLLYTMRVNYDSCVKLVFAALPWLDKGEHKSGRIVAIGSTGVFFANAMQSAYLASKSALQTFMEVLRVELDLTGRKHIETTLVQLGMVSTEQISTLNSSGLDPMAPLVISPQLAAKRIACAAQRPINEAWIPWSMWWVSFIGLIKPFRPFMSYFGFLLPRQSFLERVEILANMDVLCVLTGLC